MQMDILVEVYAAALLSPHKCKNDFTCQDLNKDEDLYHLFNTAQWTALENHKYSFFI